LPASSGFEGIGVVEAAGGGVLGRLRLGRRVAVLNGQGGCWQEQVIVPAKQVVPLPQEVPDEQGAMFFVNPASALAMTRYVLQVPSGAWLLQTAAGSALGRMVIRLGRHYGFGTINVVRRPEQGESLLKLGADAVICTETESIEKRVPAIAGSEGIRFAMDAVGGETGSEVVRALGPGGRMIVYGTLANQPMTIDSRQLISHEKQIEGFWLSLWARRQTIWTMLKLFRTVGRLMKAGILTSEVAGIFPVAEYQAAIQMAETPGREGKVLLRFSSGSP
jgi:NADPH:quinone reductase-like Zn-dependent oxidoreductase